MKKNTMFKIVNSVFVLVLVVFGYLLFFKTAGNETTNKAKTTQLDKIDKEQSAQEVINANNFTETQAESPMFQTQEPPTDTTGSVKTQFIKSESLQKISQFKDLNQKVVMNTTEQNRLKDILNDRELIQELGRSFSEINSNDLTSRTELQSLILEFLLLSLEKGDHQISLEVIKGVVLDPRIENASFDQAQRTYLAEAKAEFIFYGSALYPEEFASMKTSLPGPVTSKIWSNVAKIHADNEELSREEYSKITRK